MANEVITTATTAVYNLDANDLLYIAQTGSILYTGTSSTALRNRAATDDHLNVVIDGSVTSMSTYALAFWSATADVWSTNTIMIGATGHVTSVGRDAINLLGSKNALTNYGTIVTNGSQKDAVSMSGFSNSVDNHGTISGTQFGVRLIDQSRTGSVWLNNWGSVTGDAGAVLQADEVRVNNTGTISGTSSSFFIPSGLSLSYSTFAQVLNSGLVDSQEGTAIYLTGDAAATTRIINSGEIRGIAAIGSDVGSGDYFIHNSGRIEGSVAAIYLRDSLTIRNDAPGIITATAKGGNAAIQADGELTLSNSGTISSTGKVVTLGFGTQVASIVNWGTLAGVTDMIDASLQTGGSLTLTNRGEIEGRIYTGGGVVSIVNSGHILAHGLAIDATVQGSGSFFLKNSGTIEGGVQGGVISEKVWNAGVIDWLNLGATGDSLRNMGTITDFVLLGAGADSYDGRGAALGGWIDGGTENDSLLGGDFADDLRGGVGEDTLSGGAGDDRLEGGEGLDLLTGGLGADTFAFVGTAAVAGDRIADFVTGVDKIDLMGAMAGAAWLGGAAFTATGPVELRYASANGRLMADLNGDGGADWSLFLGAKTVLAFADILL